MTPAEQACDRFRQAKDGCEGDDLMGDKGGKKDKQKGQKQSSEKQQQKEKAKQEKLPKRRNG